MRPWLNIILTISVLLFTLGALLCFLLTVLTGSTQATVMKHFYWLKVDTSSLASADYSSTKWTNYGICDAVANTCIKSTAAYPFSPLNNFKSSTGLPHSFISQRDTFYYLSRIGYGFSIVGLFFLVLSIVPIWMFIIFGKLALISLILFCVSFLFILTSVVLSTAAYTKGKYTFQNAGFNARLGPSTMGVAWATIALLILIFAFLIIRLFGERIESANWSRNRRKRRQSYYNNNEWELRRQQMLNQDQYVNEHGGVNFMHMIEQNEYEGGNTNVRASEIDQNEHQGTRMMNFFRIKKKATHDDGDIIEQEQQYQHEDNITSNTASPMEESYYKEENSTVGGTGDTLQYYQEQHDHVNQIPQIEEESVLEQQAPTQQHYSQQQQQRQVIPQDLYPHDQTFMNSKAMNSAGDLIEKDTSFDAPAQLQGESITDSGNTQRNSRNTLDPTVLSDIDDRYPGDTNRLSGQSGHSGPNDIDYLDIIEEKYHH